MHEVYIDYLQFSVLVSEQSILTHEVKKINGFGFYTHGYEDMLGTKYFYGNPRSQKALVIISGAALHNRRLTGHTDKETINEALAYDGKISRIDHCVTDYVDTDLITPKFIKTLYRMGRVTGTLAKHGAKTISGQQFALPSHVETFYIGNLQKRGKSGIFRAYDKGLEMGLSKDLIARLELEERGDNAHMSARRIAMGERVQDIIKSRLEFEHKAMERIFDGEPIDLSRGENLIKEDPFLDNEKRWNWLMDNVVPALRKAVQFDKENGLGQSNMMTFLERSGIIDISSTDTKKGS